MVFDHVVSTSSFVTVLSLADGLLVFRLIVGLSSLSIDLLKG